MKNKNWLKDNIRSTIALLWTLCTISVFIIILFKDIKSDDKTTFMIINSLMGIMGFVLGYYFGASKTQSENTTEAIEKITKSAEVVSEKSNLTGETKITDGSQN